MLDSVCFFVCLFSLLISYWILLLFFVVLPKYAFVSPLPVVAFGCCLPDCKVFTIKIYSWKNRLLNATFTVNQESFQHIPWKSLIHVLWSFHNWNICFVFEVSISCITGKCFLLFCWLPLHFGDWFVYRSFLILYNLICFILLLLPMLLGSFPRSLPYACVLQFP